MLHRFFKFHNYISHAPTLQKWKINDTVLLMQWKQLLKATILKSVADQKKLYLIPFWK